MYCIVHMPWVYLTLLLDMQLWYSQQVEEGKAPGHPLGFGWYGFGSQDAAVGAGRGAPLYGNESDSDHFSR